MGNAKNLLSDDIRTDRERLKILIVVPLTRRWAIEMQMKQLSALNTTSLDCELLIYIDNKEISVANVIDTADRYELPKSYSLRVRSSNKQPATEVRIYARRDRIRDMLGEVQNEIRKIEKQFDMLFMIEDDTMIEPNALQRLVADHRELVLAGVKVGFIEGAQVGRHGVRMIGAWRCDDLENPTEMSTIPFNSKALFEKIDGGGLYCFLTSMNLFLDHVFYWHDECFSVDVTYGLELRKKGHTNIIDWSVVAGHADQNGRVLVPNENCTVAQYKKINDVWQLQSVRSGNV